MHIIYIHGFASVGPSAKTEAIGAAFPDATIHTPTLAFDPEASIAILNDLIQELGNRRDTEQIILIGTSLGGLYAGVLSNIFYIPAILVNPLVDMDSTNAITVGQYKNYTTGEVIDVTPDHIAYLRKLTNMIADIDQSMISVYVSGDDEVIDHTYAIRMFPFTNDKHIFTAGGHRFEQIDRIFPSITKWLDINLESSRLFSN